jgi:hypothetical protein
MYHRDVGWRGLDWIHVAEDMDQWKGLVNIVMIPRVPPNVGKSLNI